MPEDAGRRGRRRIVRAERDHDQVLGSQHVDLTRGSIEETLQLVPLGREPSPLLVEHCELFLERLVAREQRGGGVLMRDPRASAHQRGGDTGGEGGTEPSSV